MEDFYYEESNPKSVIFKIVIFLTVVICGFMIFTYIRDLKKLSINKTIKLEAGEKLPVEVDYYVKSNITDEDDYYIEVEDYELGDILSDVGEYNYFVKYKHEKKTGKIVVVDTTKPDVSVEPLTVGVNEDFNLNEFVTKCEDYSKPCHVSAMNEEDEEKRSRAGEYKFKIVINDQSGNKVSKEVLLIVKDNYSREEMKKSDLDIVRVEPSYDDYKDEIYHKFDKGFDPDDDKAPEADYIFDFLAEDIEEKLPSEYKGQEITGQELIYAYNKYGYVVAFTTKITFSNGKSIYLNN